MTSSTARQPVGIPAGGQFAPTSHAEPGISLATATGQPAQGAQDATTDRPWRPYELSPSPDGTILYDEGGLTTDCQHKVPATRSEARRALSAPRLQGRLGRVVDMGAMPGRTSSYYDDDYEVVGPTSGAPLVIRVSSGHHRFNIRSGRVHVEVSGGFDGGGVDVLGGDAGIVVDGDNSSRITVRDGAHARIALSEPSRVSIQALGGTTYVTGGGPRSRVAAAKEATVHQDGPPENRLPVATLA
ncbi:hypothetical protein ACQCSX_22125 (plasmid) [Pseudarthrobacter sp. P1]|uniref:hypothetical protein n=1 Tax=Pseudarthrobacter sp. P1 TaxID=3418418 RepID=UPI003CF1E556